MASKTALAIIDCIFDFFLFTPLVLLFWYGTYVLIDQYIISQFESAVVGAAVTLAVGVAIEFIFIYWQDAFLARGQSYQGGWSFLVYSRLYNFILATGNICHYRAVQAFYDIATSDHGHAAGWTTALQWTATSIVLLWSMRAARNISSLPFGVSLDSDPDGWFSASPLFGSSPASSINYLLDVLVTVLVVSTLGPLHWIALGYLFDATIFPDDYTRSMITSSVVGYISVAVFLSIQSLVKSLSQKYEQDGRSVAKIILEDLYIFAATAAVILTWKGVGMAVDQLAREYPVHWGDADVTALCATFGSFLLLCLCYVSGSLVAKGADMDGSLTDGEGVAFSIDYFAYFFQDEKKNQ